MRYAILLLKLLVFGYCARVIIFFITTDGPAAAGYTPPMLVFVLDSINLFIHEAGHLFLGLFGMWIRMLGGSLLQVLLPLLLAAVTWRQTPAQIAYPLFWVGESLINVSWYIRDAPYRQLKLIAKGLIHDWHWLLRDNLEAAEPLGIGVLALGILTCVSAVGVGLFHALRSFRHTDPRPSRLLGE